MNRCVWSRGTAALALLAATCALPVGAQNRGSTSLEFAESERFRELREGKQPGGDAEKAKNDEIIRKKARIEVQRMLQAASAGIGASEGSAVSDIVRNLGEVIIDPLNPRRTINQNQAEFVVTFGKEMTPELLKHIGTKEKAGSPEILVRVNAARMLSILARSGYDGVADAAVDILKNPDQIDAVKLYALKALKHLFAVPNRERPERSVFSGPDGSDREAKAIVALIDFVARKPAMTTDTPKNEVDAYRYLRREAVEALGLVRKPIVRGQGLNAQVIAEPALWLLRVANADKNLVPSPSLSERVEGLVGYLHLNPDKDENMDYATRYVAAAFRDITTEYINRKALDKPKADDKAPTARFPEERDYHPWRLTANRLQIAIRDWRSNWEDNIPAANRPANVQDMVQAVVIAADDDILKHIIAGNQTEQIVLDKLRVLIAQQIEKLWLIGEDKNSVITRPEGQ